MSRRSAASPRQQARDQLRYEEEYARGATKTEERAQAEAAYRRDRLAAIASGVPEASLPPVTKGMDVKAANERLSFATGGRGGANPGALPNRRNSSLDQASQAVANSPVPTGSQYERNVSGAVAASPKPFQPTKTPLNVPDQRITSGGAAAADAGLARNLALTQPSGGRGLLTPETGSALTAATRAPAVDPANVPNSGVGKLVTGGKYDVALDAVATPGVAGGNQFGTGSVRYAGKNEVQAPAVVSDTGVSHPLEVDQAKEDERLRAKYPELFVAGSPHNQAFIAHAKEYGLNDAYKNADSLLGTITASNRAVAAKNSAPSAQDSTLGSDAQIAEVNRQLKTPTPEQPGVVSRVAGGAYRGLQRIGEAVVGAPKAIADATRGLLPSSLTAATAPPATRGGAQPFKMTPRSGGAPVTSDTGGSGASLTGTGKALIGAGTSTYTPPVRQAQRPTTGAGSVGSTLSTAAAVLPGQTTKPDPVAGSIINPSEMAKPEPFKTKYDTTTPGAAFDRSEKLPSAVNMPVRPSADAETEEQRRRRLNSSLAAM